MTNNFLQHVTAMVTQIPAFMTKKWMNKNYLWIYMEIMKEEVYAKTVNIIQRGSIVINARKSSIGHMESNGTRQMCADVRKFYLFLFFMILICKDYKRWFILFTIQSLATKSGCIVFQPCDRIYPWT